MIAWKANSLNASLLFVRVATHKLPLKNDRILEGQVKYSSKVGVIIMDLSKAFDSLGGIWFR